MLSRTICFVALCAATFSVAAQESIRVEAAADIRPLLAEAEAQLAGGNADGAWQLLGPLEPRYAGNAWFDYLLGVAALDTGRTTAAIMSLERAASAAPEFSGARMELARAHFEAGEYREARPLFTALLNENPPSAVRDVIDRYLAAIDAGAAVPAPDFRAYAEVIVGYDDNANGSTDNDQFLGFTLNPENLATDSAFFEGGAGFNWTVPQSASYAWHLGAWAGYRKNPDAPFVDSGIVSGFGGLLWRSGAFFGRVNVDGYAASRDGESNETYAGGNLLVGRHLNERWDLNVGVIGGAARYDESIEILDVNRLLYSVGLDYRFGPRGRIGIEIIGGSDSERQAGSPYGNSKAGARLVLNTAIGARSYLRASAGSLQSDYDGLFFGERRDDTQQTLLLQIEFRDVLLDGLSFMPRVRYIDNESTVGLYGWDRLEAGLLIRWEPR